MKKKEPKYRPAVFDTETDPFEFGAEIEPFCVGFFDGAIYKDFWGDDCIKQFVAWIEDIDEPLMIFAHNGGKFDFMFLLREGYLENPVRIINGRIVSAKIGKHMLRDSYAILPVPLSAHKKDEFDYTWMKKQHREKHKSDILHYLAHDCEYLYEFVGKFIEEFGVHLTCASMAFKKLKSFHPQENTGEEFDALFRDYYYGGRVECIETGILTDDFKVYDVNSMYPAVMRDFNHPKGSIYVSSADIKPDSTGHLAGEYHGAFYCADILCRSMGALPLRSKTGIDFPSSPSIEFLRATSHEIQAGIETGRLEVIEYKIVHFFPFSQTFDEFVDTYVARKIECKQSGDKTGETFAKLVLNSSYGKSGMNPREFKDFHIEHSQRMPDRLPGREPWELHSDYGDFTIWQCPAPVSRFNNVAVAASITGAARAVLLRALSVADRPVYCDTDSIICRDLPLEHSATKLGAWKLEGSGDALAVAGKKLYALMNDKECEKMASKGVRLTPEEIFRVAQGEAVTWRKEAPSFGLDGSTSYIERTVKRIQK